jgi:hypothetical protein
MMNIKSTPGPRPVQAARPRTARPQYLEPSMPTDARTALQQSLDRRW